MNKSITINVWVFFAYFLAYCLASFLLLSFIYSGWLSLAVVPGLLLVYTILIIIFLFTAIRKSRKGNPTISISKRSLIVFTIFQLAVIFFGGGDCGDGPGIHTLFSTIFSSQHACYGDESLLGTFLGLFILHLVSVIVFSFLILWKHKITFKELTGDEIK